MKLGRVPRSLLLLALAAAEAWGASDTAKQEQPFLPVDPQTGLAPIEMSPFRIAVGDTDDHFDATGIGTMEAELEETPFSNDLVAGASSADDVSGVLNAELSQISSPTPADLTAGQSRVDVRGFPTPRTRNGFTQLGVNEVLNVDGGQQIVGPLTAVIGRAAPGGINNYLTGRPRVAPSRQLSCSFSSLDSQRVALDTNNTLRKGRAWMRLNESWSQKYGPEDYTYLTQRTLNNAYTWKASRATSLLLQLDYADYRSNPSGGVPEYRETRTGKIRGPYLPLSLFHSNGPNCGQRKTVSSVALQCESQVLRNLSLRATLQSFSRDFSEDRFTRGEYLLDEKIFTGTREPIHTELPFKAMTGQVEGTLRLHGLGADHKILLSVEGSGTTLDRQQRALASADRAIYLPDTVRTFDPAQPDYYHPSYNTTLYNRALTDRTEKTNYKAIVLSERAALANGRLVGTVGLRQDYVDLTIDDHKTGATTPWIGDTTQKLSWHCGANYILIPGRLLLFANTSTAFEPSLRIDSRTGKIQGNETTQGYEAGGTGMNREKTFAYTVTLFTYFNKNIARKNPLYDSPIYDADHTQPQLVSAGEERFRGTVMDLRWHPAQEWTFSARHTVTEAITTASPDLPEEVGRQLSRLPKVASALSVRYAPVLSPGRGYWLGSSVSYVGSYVATYESLTRYELRYPGYSVLSANGGYRWKQKKLSHSLSLSVRNLPNASLLEKTGRSGSEREASASYSLSF